MQPPGTKVGQVGTKLLQLGTKKFTPWYQSCNPQLARLVPNYCNLVPKSLPHGAKVAAHWYQSLSLVPNENLLGAKVYKDELSAFWAYYHQLQLVHPSSVTPSSADDIVNSVRSDGGTVKMPRGPVAALLQTPTPHI